MIVGTVLIESGVFFCAYLVGERANKQYFLKQARPSDKVTSSSPASSGEDSTPKPSPTVSKSSSIYWIQPAGQVLGDQVFDAFAYCDAHDPLQVYTTSWKNRRSHLEFATWIATGATFSGFVLQFVGLRGLHASVSVAQLGAMLVMSALRIALRM
jgi:hypothetical protein